MSGAGGLRSGNGAVMGNTVTGTRVGHGLDPSMDRIGLSGMTVAPFFISNHYITVDGVSFKLRYPGI